MGFLFGLVVGAAAGVFAGREMLRSKRLRQVGAALKEGRIQVIDKNGEAVTAEDFGVILDDEFRDA